MDCVSVIAAQLLSGGFTPIMQMNDGVTVAQVSRQIQKEEDQYMALLSTVDDFTARVALARGYNETHAMPCTINGKLARVFVQLKRAPRT